MTDPVTNALALQMEFGDDELKKEIDKRIREIATDVMNGLTYDPQFMNRLVANNAYLFNKQVMRAMKEHLMNNSNIY